MRPGGLSAAGKRAGFAAAYVVAAAVGRASIVDGDPMALIWPAGGLAVAWLVTRPSRREWLIDLPMLALIGSAVHLVAGLSVATTAVLTMSNLVALLATAFALGWWSPPTGRDGLPPSGTPHAMGAFLGAVVSGSLLGVISGASAYWLTGVDLSPADLAVWWGRNVCGMLAVGVPAMLIVDRIRHGRQSSGAAGSRPELALLFGATGALVALDYFTQYPVSFLLPAAAVWAGSRFPALPVAAHALAGGSGMLWLTYVGQGPFTEFGSERTGVLLAELFIAMTLVIGLFLAAAREAAATAQADLIDREREQSQELLTFARRVAHDLRNPLAVVETWTAELAATLPSEPRTPDGLPTMISGIERATARMRRLVDDLLADASARDRETAHETVDLAALAVAVAEEYGATESVHPLGAIVVAGDPVLLQQLLDNLIGNALKYVRPGVPAHVTISAQPTAARTLVKVEDRGIGIPDGAHEWIFEPFRRAHGDAYSGTGLGLSTCRRIVERHGGTMRAGPRPDGPGSIFEFDLPAVQTLPPPPSPPSPPLIEVSMSTRSNR